MVCHRLSVLLFINRLRECTQPDSTQYCSPNIKDANRARRSDVRISELPGEHVRTVWPRSSLFSPQEGNVRRPRRGRRINREQLKLTRPLNIEGAVLVLSYDRLGRAFPCRHYSSQHTRHNIADLFSYTIYI